jgi:hypothetical protein
LALGLAEIAAGVVQFNFGESKVSSTLGGIAMGILDRIREWWDNLPANRGYLHYLVRLDPVGVSQMMRSTKGVDEVRLEWSQITQVCAYKRDCVHLDQIRVALWSEDLGVGTEMTEEDAGYEELIDSLPLHLPGCLGRDEWFERMAFPAFAHNLTVLYRRAGAAR